MSSAQDLSTSTVVAADASAEQETKLLPNIYRLPLDEKASTQYSINDDDNAARNIDEELKKYIYQKAVSLNQNNLSSSRFQRINQNISEVFGIRDPPPGFGLTLPKYYYLEQHHTQPISPLKVWKGFNGSLYFEPIHLLNLSNTEHFVLRKDVTQPAISTTTTLDDSMSLFKKSNDGLGYNKQKTMVFRQFITNQMEKQQTELPPVFKPEALALTRYQTQISIKTGSKSTRPILPNLSAIRPSKAVPLKGLAFREANQRIVDSSGDEQPLPVDRTVVVERTVLADLSNHKRGGICYKDMLKHIRKGVTIHLNNEASQRSDLNSAIPVAKNITSALTRNPSRDASSRPRLTAKRQKSTLKIKGDKLASPSSSEIGNIADKIRTVIGTLATGDTPTDQVERSTTRTRLFSLSTDQSGNSNPNNGVEEVKRINLTPTTPPENKN